MDFWAQHCILGQQHDSCVAQYSGRRDLDITRGQAKLESAPMYTILTITIAAVSTCRTS
jgi:hypothetical protein